MKEIKAIRIENKDVDNTDRPFMDRLKPEVFEAVCDADVVLFGSDVVKNRYGRITKVCK